MRQTIAGFLAVAAVMVASAVPASACGGLFYGGCSPCGYVSPCAPVYVQPYWGCCAAAYELLPDPEVQYHSGPVARPQYYYVNQGPTYSGPGNFAPYPVYREGGVTNWRAYHRRLHARRYHARGPVLHSYY
jgi:hypothetical protein